MAVDYVSEIRVQDVLVVPNGYEIFVVVVGIENAGYFDISMSINKMQCVAHRESFTILTALTVIDYFPRTGPGAKVIRIHRNTHKRNHAPPGAYDAQ